MIFLHGGPEGQSRPVTPNCSRPCSTWVSRCSHRDVQDSGGFGRAFAHGDEKDKRFAAIDDVADCAKFLSERGFAEPHRIACAGWSYGGYLTLAALTSPGAVRRRRQHLRHERSEHLLPQH